MVAEMCQFYSGWTPEYCMGMHAITFFAMHRKAGQLFRIRNARLMSDLCHVATIPGSPVEYVNKVIAGFHSRLDDSKKEIQTVDGAGNDISAQVNYSVLAEMFGMYRRSAGV